MKSEVVLYNKAEKRVYSIFREEGDNYLIWMGGNRNNMVSKKKTDPDLVAYDTIIEEIKNVFYEDGCNWVRTTSDNIIKIRIASAKWISGFNFNVHICYFVNDAGENIEVGPSLLVQH